MAQKLTTPEEGLDELAITSRERSSTLFTHSQPGLERTGFGLWKFGEGL